MWPWERRGKNSSTHHVRATLKIVGIDWVVWDAVETFQQRGLRASTT